MQISKLSMFFAMYKKELRELLPEIIIISSLAIILNLALFFKANDMIRMALIPGILVIGLAAFLPVVSSFKILAKEWKYNTLYLIMSLPVSGSIVLGAKLAALASQYLIGTIVASLSLVFLLITLIPEAYTIIMSNINYWPFLLNFYILSLIVVIYVFCISFFSQLVGKLVKRFSGLLTFLVFLASTYILGEMMNYIAVDIFNFYGILVNDQLPSVAFLLANYTLVMLFALPVFIVSVLIYNYKVEL